MMKKYLLISIVLLLSIFLLAACVEDSSIEKVENNPASDERNDNESADETSSDANEDDTIEEDGLKVGDTVNFNGLHVTVKSVSKDEEGKEFFEPEKDYYLILDISIENTTDEPAHVSTLLQMSLVDPDGYAQDLGIFADTKGSLDGEVGPGRTMAGEIAFDVEDAEFFEFIFEDPFARGQAIWTIE